MGIPSPKGKLQAAASRRAKRLFTLDKGLRIFASVGKFLRHEFVAAWPVFLFFVVGFLVLLLLMKLALANRSIEMTALSKAVIAALLAAKAASYLTRRRLRAVLNSIAGLSQSLLRPSFTVPSHCCWVIWNEF